MFTSIFKKLLTTYLLTIVAVIMALSVLISFVYSQVVFEEKNKILVSAAFQINQLASELDQKLITDTEFGYVLDSLGTVTDAKIYLIRVDKQALASPDTLKIGEKLEENFLIEDLGKILDGHTVFRQKQYSAKFNMNVVFAGVPWKTKKGIEGAVLLYSPVSHLTDSIKRINITTWVIALIFIFISAIVIYFNSLRISKPIHEMEFAAKKLAEGENTEDIVIKGRDEIGKLAETFNFMKKQLLATEKMRREFIANVSHDLRTPLTSISGFVQGMLDGVVKPENQQKVLLIMKEETDRLTRMTSDILQLAKLQSGSIKLNKEHLNMNNIIQTVLESNSSLIAEKSLTLTVECDEKFEVYADEDRLKQILINLIENAVKYNKQDGTISIKIEDLPGMTRVSIKDTGIGIPSEELQFIFEKFYRVDKTRQSPYKGTGLGLDITKSLIELHGGRIWAISELGAGTEILFELPE